jgi:hypothetical protein
MTTTNRNAPIPARKDALNKKSNEPNQQPNLNPKVCVFQYKTYGQSKLSHTTAFACDECSLPLLLYGENFIETYSTGRANILRCLCDLHAEEFGLLEVNAR